MAIGEAEDVPRIGVPPAVDQLVVVTAHAHVPVRAGHQVDERGLRVTRVLELVGQDPSPPLPQPRQPVRMLGKQPDRAREQIIELERVTPPQLPLALPPHRRDQRRGHMSRAAHIRIGGHQRVLGAGDLGEHLGARRLPVVGQRPLDLTPFGVGQQPVDHPAHVGLVVDRVALGAPEHAGVLAEQPRAHRVKRRRRDRAGDGFAEQIGEPQAELAGGTNAEGDREDLPRLSAPASDQERGAVRQRAGLAGTRPREQQQRAGAERDGLRLLGGQPREQSLGPGRRRIALARVGSSHASPPSGDRMESACGRASPVRRPRSTASGAGRDPRPGFSACPRSGRMRRGRR